MLTISISHVTEEIISAHCTNDRHLLETNSIVRIKNIFSPTTILLPALTYLSQVDESENRG